MLATTPTPTTHHPSYPIDTQVNLAAIAAGLTRVHDWFTGAQRVKWFAQVQKQEMQQVRPVSVVRTSEKIEISSPVPTSGDCGSLLVRYFGDVLAWAQRIVQRESGCDPGAYNPAGCDSSGRTNSHAEGFWQICVPLNAWAFSRAGCSSPLEGDCNMRAARVMFDTEGESPWR
jgi:hypothetical protein